MYSKELNAFIAVYETCSISKAAEKLYITQPALTRTIQNLEEQIGSELFLRTREGLVPTIVGELYMESAEKILKVYKEFDFSLAYINKENRGRLTIGTKMFFSSSVLPKVICAFEKQYPNVELTIYEGLGVDVEKKLLKNNVDVAIIHLPVISEQLIPVPIGRERFMLAVDANNKLNDTVYYKEGETTPYMDLSLCKNENFLLTQPNQKIRQDTDRILCNAGVKPHVKLQSSNLQTIAKLVSEGVGISLIPSSYINSFHEIENPKYYNIESSLDPFCEVGIIYHKDMKDNLFIKEFIEIAKKSLKEVFCF